MVRLVWSARGSRYIEFETKTHPVLATGTSRRRRPGSNHRRRWFRRGGSRCRSRSRGFRSGSRCRCGGRRSRLGSFRGFGFRRSRSSVTGAGLSVRVEGEKVLPDGNGFAFGGEVGGYGSGFGGVYGDVDLQRAS
jgi:hypothetical protein